MESNKAKDYLSRMTCSEKALLKHLASLQDHKDGDIFRKIAAIVYLKTLDAMNFCDTDDTIQDVIFFAIRESSSEIYKELTQMENDGKA